MLEAEKTEAKRPVVHCFIQFEIEWEVSSLQIAAPGNDGRYSINYLNGYELS